MQKKVFFIFGLIYCLTFLVACTATKPDQTLESQEPIIVDTLPTASSTAITYTIGDVASHSKETDCWTAIDGKVYDISMMVKTHKGGPAIIKACGIDASNLFNSKHPDKKNLLDGYRLGELIK